MAERLTNFVLALGEDPAALTRFRDDPDVLMSEAGLSGEEQAILRSEDPVRIRQAVAEETLSPAELLATTIVATIVIIIHHEAEEEVSPVV